MSIPLSKYIFILSGVGAARAATEREYIGRIFTENPLVAPNQVIEFTNLDAVGLYFGTETEEYLRAQAYFSFKSKSITSPQKLSFGRYVSSAVPPRIFGRTITETLANLLLIEDGSFKIIINGTPTPITGLDFTAATNYTDIATIIETALQANAGVPILVTASVDYVNTKNSFDFVGGVPGNATIAIDKGTTGTDISTIIGWYPEGLGVIWSSGSVALTPQQSVQASASISNNFATFCFTTASDLSLDDTVALATWTDSLNVAYWFQVPGTPSTSSSIYTALKDIGANSLILMLNEYDDVLPMAVMASTDYNAPNSVQNYMYQRMPSFVNGVTTLADSDAYDAIRVNYMGQTQQGGENVNFFQRGVMMGSSEDPVTMTTFANELWFKSRVETSLLNLFLRVNQIPVNPSGKITILANIQKNGVDAAIYNGVISVGKELTEDQIDFINTITGNTSSWRQVQNNGYWLDGDFVPSVASSGITEYAFSYTLIYSKNDVVNRIIGRQLLV